MPTTFTTQPIIAFFDEIGESVTPTSSTGAQSGYPLTNMKGSLLADQYRATAGALTDVRLTWDHGSSIEIGMAAIMSNNLTSAALARYRQATDSGFTTGVLQSGASNAAIFDYSLGSLISWSQPWGRLIVYVLPTSGLARYTRWHFTDTTNPNNYLALGPARFGMPFQPANGMRSENWQMRDRISGPPGSQVIKRTHTILFSFLTRAEAYKFATLIRGVKESRRVLVVPEPNKTDTLQADAIWATVEGAYERSVMVEGDASGAVSGLRYGVSVTFVEADW